MTRPLLLEELSRERIETLRAEASAHGDVDTEQACLEALWSTNPTARLAARQQCLWVINACRAMEDGNE